MKSKRDSDELFSLMYDTTESSFECSQYLY